MERSRERVNAALERWIPAVERELPGSVGAAVAYSLRGPGKRLRPALVFAVYREAGGTGDPADLGAALEVVHTYSLVHDDLPCMDDDALRRGRPTTHVAYDVAVAMEAGFRMVPLAGRMVARAGASLGLARSRVAAIGQALFAGAGPGGMIGGQVMDLEAEGRELRLEELQRVHRAKTGALITASAAIGGLAAGLDASRLAAVRAYGDEIGLAFQIVDDVLDATMTSAQLGKTAGKDAVQHKATFASLMGTAQALDHARACVDRAVDRLGDAGIDSDLLPGIARYFVDRRS